MGEMKMNLYLISQNENDGYDTYDSLIVAANNEEEASTIHPDGSWENPTMAWCSSPALVTVEYIGKAAPNVEKGLILASFNAG